MNSQIAAQRRCLACGTTEPIGGNEPMWPLGWRCRACGQSVIERDGIPLFAPALADTISGMDPKNFDKLARVETEYFWFVARYALIVGLIDKYFPDARRFLEVGCGNGAVLQAVARSRSWERLVGTELHPSGLVYARKRLPAAEFAQMDARYIPAVNAFDLTGAFDVIEHIDDDEGVLRGMRAATRAGGGIIIAVPQHQWLWSHADVIAHHQRRYRRGEVEAKLRRNGFDVVFSSSYTALLLPLMAVNRLKNQRHATEDDVLGEFRLNRNINAIFTAILRAEVRATLAGVKWPGGGSRVVVARAV
jgi:SAM-dependent methyltransferase